MVCVVSADEELCAAVSSLLDEAGYRTATGASPPPDPALFIVSDRDAIEALRAGHPNVPVLLIAAKPDSSLVRAASRRGAQGVVVRGVLEQRLRATVEAVLCGQVVLPAEAVALRERPTLSGREKQILGLVVMGLSNADIARQLFVTESTVKSHLSSTFAKLGVSSRNEATALVLDPEEGVGLGIMRISE